MISLRSPRIDSFFICNLTVRFNTLHMLCSLNLINGKQQKKKKLRREDVDCLSGTCRIKIQLKHFCQSHIAGVNSIIRRIELLIKFLQSLIRTCCCHVRFELIKRKAKTTKLHTKALFSPRNNLSARLHLVNDEFLLALPLSLTHTRLPVFHDITNAWHLNRQTR